LEKDQTSARVDEGIQLSSHGNSSSGNKKILFKYRNGYFSFGQKYEGVLSGKKLRRSRYKREGQQKANVLLRVIAESKKGNLKIRISRNTEPKGKTSEVRTVEHEKDR